MARKDDSIFGLAPVAQTPTYNGNGRLVPYQPGRALTKEELRIIAEWEKEQLVIDVTTAKAACGMQKIGEVHQHAATIFDETAGYILAVKAEQRGKEHQAYVDEFSTRQLQMFGRQMLGTVESATYNIGVEIHRSLYFQTEEEKHSFLQRLFGT